MTLRDLGDDALDLMRQRAAIGVAEHDPARAGFMRGLGAGERVIADCPCSRRRNARNRRAPPCRARRRRRPTGVCPRDCPRASSAARRAPDNPRLLATKVTAIAIGVEQRGDARIVGGRASLPPRHAEGGEARAQRRPLREEFRVERIGAGIAALDIIDAELVEHARRSARLSSSEKSTPVVCAPSRSVVSNSVSRSRARHARSCAWLCEFLLHRRVAEPFAAQLDACCADARHSRARRRNRAPRRRRRR